MGEVDTELARHSSDASPRWNEYKGYIRRKNLVLAIEVLAVAIIALIAICSGSSGVSLDTAVAALLGQGDPQVQNIVWKLRMPRILTALLGGIGLAVAGCAFQSVLRNPLGAPSTLGVSQGAAFGASVAIILFGAGSTVSSNVADAVNISNPYLVSGMAFAGSMLSTAVILGLSRFRQITPEGMILCGVALSALFSGGTTLIQYFASDVQVAAVVFWTFGDLGRTSYREVGIIAVFTAAALVFFLLNRWTFLARGPASTPNLSTRIARLRILHFFCCFSRLFVLVIKVRFIASACAIEGRADYGSKNARDDGCENRWRFRADFLCGRLGALSDASSGVCGRA